MPIRPDPDGTRAPSGHARTFWVAFAFFAILSSLWALAAPVFAVADENAHATKAIAQVRGQVVGYEAPGARYIRVDLPPDYRYNPDVLCFVFKHEVPANCNTEFGASGSPFFDTWVGGYNPVYYYLVGWPSLLFGGPAGIYAMRIASALVGAVFLAWATQVALASAARRWMPLGVAFLASPMIIYFIGSVNPQGLEVAAASALWIATLRLLQTWREPDATTLGRRYLWVIVTVSAVLVANVRALGPLWVVVIVGTCLAIAGWRATRALFATARSYWWIGAIALSGLFSVGWTLFGGSLSGQAAPGEAPIVGASFLRGFTVMLRNTPDYIRQAAGNFGWFDVPLQTLAYIPFFVAFGLLVVIALLGTNRRGARVMALLMGVAVLVPALVQAYSVRQTGIIWQGRYGLFLYVAVPLVAALLLSSDAGRRLRFLSVRMTVVVVGLLAAFGIGCFVLVLRRYVVGSHLPVTDMITRAAWQPPLGWPILLAALIVVWVAFAGWIVARSRSAALADRVPPSRA